MEPVEATRVSTDHLEITTYLSDGTITSGTRFSLVLDVEPRPGMHVYAPGAEADGYRVVTLRMDPQPYVRLMPIEYPVSESYLFEPLDEVEPVYLDRFILRQDIVLEATRGGGPNGGGAQASESWHRGARDERYADPTGHARLPGL